MVVFATSVVLAMVPSVVPPAVPPRVVGLWIPTARIGGQVAKFTHPARSVQGGYRNRQGPSNSCREYYYVAEDP